MFSPNCQLMSERITYRPLPTIVFMVFALLTVLTVKVQVSDINRTHQTSDINLIHQTSNTNLTHKDVFIGGKDKPEGYRLFRIPSIVAYEGIVMIFVEGRKNSRKDPGPSDAIDIVYKRSEDGGDTWSSLKVLADGHTSTSVPNARVAYQPTTVMDTKGGRQRIYLFYNRAHLSPFYRYSDDLGLTWSQEVGFLPALINKPPGVKKLTVNLGSGVQMEDGKLVIPTNTILSDDSNTHNRPSVVYSDDHGVTWKYGGHSEAGANEHQLTEVFIDGQSRLYSSSRQDARSVNTRRVNYGKFNHTTEQWDWTDSSTLLNERNTEIMATPVSAAIERYTRAAGCCESTNRLLFVIPQGKNASGQLGRYDLAVYVSTDEGRHFDKPRILHSGQASYSDIANVDGDRFMVAWERGNDGGESAQFVTLTTANRKFLDCYPLSECDLKP